MFMNKKIISMILMLTLIFAFTGTAFASDSVLNEKNLISEKYEYPVTPGNEEWSKFKSRLEKINACQIPEDILSRMTTEALVETVMEYPLLIDMVVRDSKREGFNAILNVFNGLQELVKRPDGLSELEQYQKNLSIIKTYDKKIVLKKGYIDYMIIGLGPNNNELGNSVKYSHGNVYTPNGTSVSTYEDLVWDDHNLTASLADYYDDQLSLTYPNATQLRQEDPSYNCHSYAWYSTSSLNSHWIDYPNAYMTDGSYYSGGAQVGSKVWYGAGNHSGIVVYVGGGSGPNVGVYSKWGSMGLHSHNIVDCPYTESSYSCTFWN